MVVDGIASIVDNTTTYITQAINTLQEWTNSLRELTPPQIREQIDELVVDTGETIGTAFRSQFIEAVSVAPSILGLALGILALPVFLFFILKDWEKLGRAFYAELPSWGAQHARNVVLIVEKVLGRYFRAQLTLGLAVGFLSLIGFLLLGVPFGWLFYFY